MNITKYKVTAQKAPGYMMVIYQDGVFKSVLNEFKPALKEKQLNFILNLIPNDIEFVDEMFKQAQAYLTITPVNVVSTDTTAQPLGQYGAGNYPVNEKIALWCCFYANSHKDELGADVKYKTGQAEAGKLKALVITPEEFNKMLTLYFASDEWWSKPKSISNFINKYNELRALAYAKPKEKTFPLPYDDVYFAGLGTMEKKAYQSFLRANGYRWEMNPGRGGKWVNY